MWRRKIGDSAFDHVRNRFTWRSAAEGDRITAFVLDGVVEVGFRAPEVAPRVDPAGTKVLWPQGVLTPAGLIEYYGKKGHKYVLLQLGPLFRGVGQLLLPRLQEVLAAYELQCAAEGLPAVPVDHYAFLGGDGDSADIGALREGLTEPVKADVSRVSG